MLVALETRGDYMPGWGKHDLKIATSPKARQKIERRFANVSHDFAFYLHFQRGDLPKDDDYKAYIAKRWPGAVFDNRISVVLNNNSSSLATLQQIGAWTLAHRFMHCVQVNGDYNEAFIWHALADCATLVSDFDVTVPDYLKGSRVLLGDFRGARRLKEFSQAVLTMRCARERKMYTELDVIAEMMAQYLLTGRVRFNAADEMVRQIGEIWAVGAKGDPAYHPASGENPVLRRDVDLNTIQAILDQACDTANRTFEELLVSLRGQVVSF